MKALVATSFAMLATAALPTAAAAQGMPICYEEVTPENDTRGPQCDEVGDPGAETSDPRLWGALMDDAGLDTASSSDQQPR